MVSYELVRLDADGRPLEAIYPVIETHPMPEVVGEFDYDGKPENRFEFGYFGMLRARLLALWAAGIIPATQLGKMLDAVSRSNIGSDPFSDDSETEANDETVIEMFENLTDVNRFLHTCDVDWIKPFRDSDGYAPRDACIIFARHLLKAVFLLQSEPIKTLSEEQLDAYGALADFLLESPNGVGVL